MKSGSIRMAGATRSTRIATIFICAHSPRGIRLHCTVGIGASLGNSRAAWLEFLNTANERSHVTQFSLFEDDAGVYRIRMRALFSGAYSRPVFAMAMDMWHDDLAQVRRKPRFVEESDAGEDDDVAVTVN